jgi:hypothetical protein
VDVKKDVHTKEPLPKRSDFAKVGSHPAAQTCSIAQVSTWEGNHWDRMWKSSQKVLDITSRLVLKKATGKTTGCLSNSQHRRKAMSTDQVRFPQHFPSNTIKYGDLQPLHTAGHGPAVL